MSKRPASIHFWITCCWFITSSLSPFFSQAQVTADFTSTSQSGCSPLTVQFFSTSSGPITSYAWDFGNGNTSTLQNPGVIYINPGTYTVSLTVSDGANIDNETKTAYITVFADPVVDFTANPNGGCVSLSVDFTDISTPGDAPINAWTWDFGDGNISNLQNPTHVYNSTDSYDVTLVVTDTNGCSATLVQPDFVTVGEALTVDPSITAIGPCTQPLDYAFDATVLPAGSYSYFWDFGDGFTSPLQSPVHTYGVSGSYTVMLIVTDPASGCMDTTIQFLTAQLQAPSANFSLADTLVCVGQNLDFVNLSTGATNYIWDFGDGTSVSGPNPSHSYLNPGNYTVRLIAVSPDGCTDTLIKPAYVHVQNSPTAFFVSTDPTDCQAGLIVDFTDGSSADVINWFWDFGDGNTATAPSPSHVYNGPGIFDVQLIVENNFGCQDTLLQPNYVQIIPPNASFIADTISGCLPLKVDFLDLSTTLFDSIDTWIWDFGDGANSFVQNPSHTYTVPGQFDVTLIVQTVSGCRDTTVFSFIEAGHKPVIEFTANPLIVCAEDPVVFQDQSSLGSNFLWEFGDGTMGNGPNPTHFYVDTGTFDVSLIVTHFGCRDTLIKPDFIQVLAPIAEFVMTPTQGCVVPLGVAFFDQSTDPHSWFWDFGDGTTDTVQNPVHVYNNLGNYLITLVVTNDSTGCVSSFVQDIDIFPPFASFSVNQTNGCTGLPVSFNNSSVNADFYFWDFGDGNTSTAANPTHQYSSPGNFDVMLIASSINGCADTMISSSLVNIVGPEAFFEADTTTGCAPLGIQFTDLSTAFPAGTFITGWNWDFGDGGSSNSQNPIYTYNNPGSYDVRLIVADNQGCADTLTLQSYINPTYPSANFITLDTLSCPGSLVSFTNLSTGVGNSYFWDFGDGTTSSAVNPVHVFPPSGTFTVSLTATDINGCVSNSIMVDLVSIGYPVANFFADPTNQACPPLTVNFTDLSSPHVSSWFWDFGDGSTSSLPNPSKVYSIPGQYDVSLIVSTNQGCMDTLQMPDLINLSGPSGNFSLGPITGCNPLTVNFSASTDSAISWTWDFGDGNLGFGQNVSHTYTEDTIAFPVLLIQDTAGCTVAIPAPDSVTSLPGPQPSFFTDLTNLCLGQSVQFTNTTIGHFPIVNYNWDFGDNTSSAQANPLHVYAGPGTYTPTLIATDINGCTDSIMALQPIQVDIPPEAHFSPSNLAGCIPFQVVFSDSSISASSLTYAWDMGDGNTYSSQFPSHTYTTAGTYTIKLLITDVNGCQDSTFQTITAWDVPSVDFVAAPTEGCAPKNVQFLGLGSGPTLIDTWFWDFGDGNSSTQQNPLHTYQNDGLYSVSLTITDLHGCTASLLQPDLIELVHPVATFTSDATPGCPVQTVSFSPNVTGNAPISNWFWYFGDGDSAFNENPVHVYDTAGTYDVTLIVTDVLGCSDTLTDPQHVVIHEAPSSEFFMDSLLCDSSLVSILNFSTMGSSPITSYLFDFGNGNSSGQQNPVISYGIPGTYTVSLIVTDLFGCQDTSEKQVTVFSGIEADFAVSNPIACSNAPINFLDLSSGVNPPVSWQWDFGDSTGSGLQFPVHIYDSAGLYTVSLVVEDINGCTDTMVQTNAIDLEGPLAAFSLSAISSCPGASVDFFDNSIGDTTLSAWFWDFGDGTTSTSPNPSHVYTSPGTYDVSLTITNVLGCDDTEIQSAVITVIPPPSAAIALSDSSGCVPLSIQFADSSTSNVNLSAWEWDFGNGNSSVFPNPTHTYTSSGSFMVELVVTDINGCTDTAQYPLLVYDLPQVEFAASDTSGCASKTVSFLDMSNASSNLVDWFWEFGDGNTSTLQSPINTYMTNGSYTVQLTVTDANGCTDSLTKMQYVNLEKPHADFGINTHQGCPDFTFQFSDLSTADTTISNWLWTFGDGNSSTLENPSHSYADTGSYTISLTITDFFGCTATISKTDTISVLPPPQALFVMPDSADCSPFVAQFFDASIPANGVPILDWTWDLGNGNTANFPNTNSTYTVPGFYPVTLTVTDAQGCIGTFTDTLQVFFPPQANFLANTEILCVDDTLNFLDVSSGTAAVTSWFWDFGDGNQSNQQSPGHSYQSVGTYTVMLIVLDENGCADTLIRPDYITVTQPDADFSLDKDADCPGITVSFQDVSLADTTLTAWTWDFGDGNSSNLLQPDHTYTQPGVYTVSLTVTNILGCTDTEIKVDTITVFSPPVPDFSPADSAGCAPFSTVFFDNSSSSVPIQNWDWDLGDGTTANLVNPSHNYPNPGIYTIQLVLTDANGCMDSLQKNIEVYALPQANFISSDTIGCAPEAMLFTDLSFPAPVEWEWHFGDGMNASLQNPVHTYTNTGTYDVQLIITDANGCVDSLNRLAYIELSQPIGDFTVDYMQDCPPVEAIFQAAASSDFGIASYSWNFGDGNVGLGTPVIHTYSDTGSYSVSLIITDSLGCSDTIHKPDLVQVFGVDLPESPGIHRVSVRSDFEIEVMWERNNSDDFAQYVLYREHPVNSGNWLEIYRSQNFLDTVFIDVGSQTGGLECTLESYCYRLTTVNYCGTESPLHLAPVHCSINALAEPLPDRIVVSWNEYVGWDAVELYEVYRVSNYDPNQVDFLDMVPGFRTNYIDTAVNCFNTYTYRIKATGFELNQISWSDTTEAMNQKSGIHDINELVRATVAEDRYVQIEWLPFFVSDLEGIFLEKSSDEGATWTTIQQFDAFTTTYYDTAVQVHEQSYWYRLYARDSCGFSSPVTNLGTSIHLKLDTIDYHNLLKWTPYELWEGGVDFYEVQLFNEETQQWVIRQIVPGDVLEYRDTEVELEQGEYCYRILAYEKGGNLAQSLSNVACLPVIPKIYAPTAFSPNFDNVNDRFYLQGLYVDTYNLKIFNRWGLQVFEGRHLDDSWDGTYMGHAVQEGVYVYVAEGFFLTGQPFQVKGTVTLLR